MYSELQLELIVGTLDTLRQRIEERFPGSGLARVASELLGLARQTGAVLERMRRPNVWLRTGIGIAIVLIAAVIGLLAYNAADLSANFGDDAGSVLQTVEAATQILIFFALAILFLFTLESRMHRRTSLQALHRLRSIVHIVDMHQLTKDPEHFLTPGMSTASSPERTFTRFELKRYLNYCSELLSLTSKLAALHVQHLNDPIVLDAVNDIEVLASNLSNKMWQKIVVLDTAVTAET